MKRTKVLAAVLVMVMMMAALASCAQQPAASAAPSAEPSSEPVAAGTGITAGTYTAQEQGFGGVVEAKVTVDENGKITALEVAGADETPNIGGTAIETLTAAMLSSQSGKADAVAGATVTSDAVVAAVASALKQAGVNE